MDTYTEIWARKTANFRVALAWAYDDCDPTEHMEDDLAEEVRAKIDAGKWSNYVFRVRVTDSEGNELGSDYLGGSIHADPADFAKERRGGYFPDMVRTAIAEARKAYNAPRATLRAA